MGMRKQRAAWGAGAEYCILTEKPDRNQAFSSESVEPISAENRTVRTSCVLEIPWAPLAFDESLLRDSPSSWSWSAETKQYRPKDDM
jgi:hypothetical protein